MDCDMLRVLPKEKGFSMNRRKVSNFIREHNDKNQNGPIIEIVNHHKLDIENDKYSYEYMFNS